MVPARIRFLLSVTLTLSPFCSGAGCGSGATGADRGDIYRLGLSNGRRGFRRDSFGRWRFDLPFDLDPAAVSGAESSESIFGSRCGALCDHRLGGTPCVAAVAVNIGHLLCS
jgi:hypothetical protein